MLLLLLPGYMKDILNFDMKQVSIIINFNIIPEEIHVMQKLIDTPDTIFWKMKSIL